MEQLIEFNGVRVLLTTAEYLREVQSFLDQADLVIAVLPATRPDYISVPTWDILIQWSEGKSQRRLAKEAGTTSVSERIYRAIVSLERHRGGMPVETVDGTQVLTVQ